ncbi:MAG: ATP-binding cassette domain-containing protein [Anaerolineaceae bacterium]|nr:ATP-binding cassette domain-containing protein [Anaerolineaceae bacterium]
MDKKPLLEVSNLSKRFGTLSALRSINLEIYPGEVVGITGQSGSGKSTLAMVLAGRYPPDEGEIYYHDKPLHWPYHIRSLGIEVIHQTPRLAENLDITSNIFLGNEISWSIGKWLMVPNQLEMDQRAAAILAELGVSYTSLREEVYNLSREKRQMVAVAQVMTGNPRLIIIDDPTQILSYPFQKKLLSLIAQWQQQGISVLFFSNNLDHLLDVTERIIVLRKGYRAAEFKTEDADREEIIASMVGTTDYQQLIPIIWALDNYYHAREHADNLQMGQILFEREQISQESLRHQLVDRLTEQITSLDSTNQALQNAQRRLMSELEKERKYLAREIHDQIIQDLLSTNYQIEELESSAETTPALKENLSDIRDSIRSMIDELRNICGSLRPPTIDSMGVNAAILSFAQEWSKRTGIEIKLDLDPDIGRFSESIELSIYRIVQEGLNNVHKHSNANHANIGLKRFSPRALMVTISDDGNGLAEDFDLNAYSKEGHYGLLGIGERVALLGGRLRVQNQPEGGLLIQAEIPHPRS